MLSALASTFGFGIVYFLAAVPAGVAMGLSPWRAAVAAWAGYTAIASVVPLAGAPLRAWLVRKFRINLEPNPQKLFWRVWQRWGLAGLSLIAPITCGPYFAALIGLALGERAHRLIFWIGLGGIPWAFLFALLTSWGISLKGG